ncbi:phosphomevalonate kinase [Nocardia alba]|uniref:phosphomevalonate kinase n=1 Tax=Nocardia alba TaxID=225051 RepID=A0A4R1FLF2_9NOCA|nr:phosphomevalonate kinase [Nocardia alba]TCJ95353.1 phosphomevalonate kinase [Nocardia alba]
MISCRAPGKLFIAGEYAVVEPGHLAVLTAVDRFATATIAAADPADGITVHSDLDGGITLSCGRHGDELAPTSGAGVPAAFSYVFAAVSVVHRLLLERAVPVSAFRLDVTADLGDTDGRKFGLGSSAAVTVATVDALGRYFGLGLDPMRRYRLAMLATMAVNPRASGGDVAVSTWGGWLAYRSPDRTQVAAALARDGVEATLRAPWPGLSVRPLPTPTELTVQVGWTGNPASTPALVAGLGGDRTTFQTSSDACVERLVAAVEFNDSPAIRDEIDSARTLLVGLDAMSGLGIMTPRLHALCAEGAAVGAAAKPSGAGGGDCGIALIERTRPAAIAELTGRWLRAGIRPLPLRTYLVEGDLR